MSSTIFHISDTHLGYRNRSHPDGHGDTTGIEEANSVQAFDKIIWDAIKENVDAVIHTGDLFDHHVDGRVNFGIDSTRLRGLGATILLSSAPRD